MKRVLAFHSNAVWPPFPLVALFAGVYGLVEVSLWFIQRSVPNAQEALFDLPEIAKIRALIFASAAGCYALFRLWRFHPVCSQAYAAWLKLSPWTPDKPPPLGPVHLVWQDAVVVGTITLIATWHAHADPAWPLAGFGFAYLIGMTLLLAATRTWKSCLALGFLWPTLFLPGIKGTWGMGGVLAALILVVWAGFRRSLRAFPWSGAESFDRPNLSSGNSIWQKELTIPGLDASATRMRLNVGWPYRVLSPKVEYYPLRPATTFYLSILLGWWTFCVIVGQQSQSTPGLIALFAIVAAVSRLVLVYCSRVAPPFNVLGRIVSRQIVVPGYDRVFLTPLAVIMAGVVGGTIVRWSGSWYPATEAGAVALIWMLLLGGGPTLRNWLLTGQHRYRPQRLVTGKESVRPV